MVMSAESQGLQGMWRALEGIGRDGRTGGYRRDAWSPADLELREWFAQEADRRGLDRYEDRNGNLWAWWGDPDERPGVVTGSHLDSVRDGGAFDGPLGVASAFAAIDRLRDRGFAPARPIGVVCFTDEEGARFGVPCVGSRLLAGLLDPRRARALADDAGDTLTDVLARAGRDPYALGRDHEAMRRIGVFVELHIEQGRGLAPLGAPVGVASAIWPHGRWRFEFRGRTDHAGTTALNDRRDAMLPFAATVLAAREAAREHGVVATFGKVRVEPGNANAIPGRVTAWLDARGADEAAVRRLVAELADGHEVTCESWIPLVAFDVALRDRVAWVAGRALEEAGRAGGGENGRRPGRGAGKAAGNGTAARGDDGRAVPVLPTGAGHDAGILAAAGIPSAMLFVRNPTGVSHSPEEHAEPEDCQAGVVALAAVLEDLCTGGVRRGHRTGE
ncbi:Zn-dependent hydrolase [Thermopolyspora flexuosa]|jgi:N-carbamoyl-L-amino-acid hydrolase|uniref:N-carbamoyl-L-amino-acid hydrolase n=2 Tax=Thermopolyspora flexuosa TaxID=103836 RepID=A0A543J164_9ACTN|nr:allantoate amidohydrolase [Thermopolyspora flexuosa]TQM76560.1 N-carbamoyl-L-amino-acid hydrolase [Thermopolyspora flexuosa]GGM85146.1 Zn-dependent hydrolase [Thermopolyspora flexuosa]